MSMNMFFVACKQDEIIKMADNHALIDELVESKGYAFSTDIETAWDVLKDILGGTGILVGDDIDDALYNGCSLVSSEVVKAQAALLSQWSKEQVLTGLQTIEDEEAYHLEVFQDDEDYLWEQFEKMQAFYQEAAQKGLAAILYLA